MHININKNKGFTTIEMVVATAALLLFASFYLINFRNDADKVVAGVSNQMDQFTEQASNNTVNDSFIPNNPSEETWSAEKKCSYYGGSYTNGNCQCPANYELKNGWCIKNSNGSDETLLYQAMKMTCLNGNNTWDEETRECIYDAKDKCIYPYEWNGLSCGYIGTLDDAYDVIIVELLDGNYAVTGPKSDLQYTATIPSSYKGKPITQISGFKNRTDLKTITFAEGSTFVPDDFCYGCKALTTLNLPSTMETIGNRAFYAATSLPNVTIPDSVISIGNDAFYNTTALTSLMIPDSVTSIGQQAFYGSGIKDLSLPSGIAYGENVFKNVKLNTLVAAAVDTMPVSTFAGAQLTDVHIGSETSTIPADLFKSKNIAKLTLDEGIEMIGACAFEGNKLTTLALPSTVSTIDTKAFLNNTIVLDKLVLSDNLIVIGDNAFENNTIKQLVLTPYIEEIGSEAFKNTKMTSLTLKDNVSKIGANAFYGNSLGVLNLPADIVSIQPFSYKNAGITKIISDADTLEIQEEGFADNKIANSGIPQNLTKVGINGFANNGITELDFGTKIEFMDAGAFKGNPLTKVVYHTTFTPEQISINTYDDTIEPEFYFNEQKLNGKITGSQSISGSMLQASSTSSTLNMDKNVAVYLHWDYRATLYASISGWNSSHSQSSGRNHQLLTNDDNLKITLSVSMEISSRSASISNICGHYFPIETTK